MDFSDFFLGGGSFKDDDKQEVYISSRITRQNNQNCFTLHALHYALVLHACYTGSARPAHASFILMHWSPCCLPLDNRELKQPRRRRQQRPYKFAYLTMKISIFACFARAFFIFWHFVDVLILSATRNDLFCSCVDDVSAWWQMFNFVFLCPKRWFQLNSRIVRTHFSSIRSLNNWKMVAEMRSHIFRWRSRFRRRRVCLSSQWKESDEKQWCYDNNGFSSSSSVLFFLSEYLSTDTSSYKLIYNFPIPRSGYFQIFFSGFYPPKVIRKSNCLSDVHVKRKENKHRQRNYICTES